MYIAKRFTIKKMGLGRIKLNTTNLVLLQLLFLLNIQWIIDLLKLPGVVVRLEIIIPVIISVLNIKKIISFIKKEVLIFAFFAIYFFNMLAGWILNGVNPLYVVWNSFSNYIFFLFFASCCVSLKKEDICKGLEIMSKFHILNVLLCLYQYLVLGLYSDYLGGLFGIRQGCNGAQNIFAVVVCCYQMYKFMQGGKLYKLLFYLGSFIIIAALADIMGFFIELGVCATIMLLGLPKISKKIKIIILVLVVAIVGLEVFSVFYPQRFEYFLNINNWIRYIGFGQNNDGGIYGISRVNPFSQINNLFFDDDLSKKIFGIGYGNAVYSDSIKALQSPFYLLYKNYPYYWFATAYTYVESGWIGIISYLALLFSFVYSSNNLIKRSGCRNIGVMGYMYAASYLFIFFYNQSLIVTPAYMMYFALATTFIYQRQEKGLITDNII